MRDSNPAWPPAAKRLAGTVNDTVRAAAGSGAVAADPATDAVTPSPPGGAADPGRSGTVGDEWGVMPSGACQLRAPVESWIRRSALDPGAGAGTEIVTVPVAAVECPTAMCVVGDRPEFASALWNSWPPG